MLAKCSLIATTPRYLCQAELVGIELARERPGCNQDQAHVERTAQIPTAIFALVFCTLFAPTGRSANNVG